MKQSYSRSNTSRIVLCAQLTRRPVELSIQDGGGARGKQLKLVPLCFISRELERRYKRFKLVI
jgi:hypothetical protein